jgi:hypothetical protein
MPSSIEPFLTGERFDPEAKRAMGLAFDTACRALLDTGHPDLVREVVADRIIDMARRGERDPQKLFDAALRAVMPSGSR